MLALVVLGSLSDGAGRRPLLAGALVVAATSTVLFLLARDVEVLLAARFLSGLATGVVTATATAALGELAPEDRGSRTSIAATAANMGGLGLGAVVAGLFAQFGPDPTHLVFWAYLVALLPALVAVAVVPETVLAPHRRTVQVRRPTLPPQQADRAEFLRAATAVFAAFAVSGLFSSLVPSFLHEQLHVHDVAAVGGEVGLLFITALLAQLAVPARWLSWRWLTPAVLAGGVVVFETGLWARSLPVFIIGTLLAGAGIGLAFRRGVAVTQRLADPARRADLLSTYFLAAYAGTIVPTLALGLLDQAIGQDVATLVLAVGVVAAALSGGLGRTSSTPGPADRTGRRRPAAPPPPAPHRRTP